MSLISLEIDLTAVQERLAKLLKFVESCYSESRPKRYFATGLLNNGGDLYVRHP